MGRPGTPGPGEGGRGGGGGGGGGKATLSGAMVLLGIVSFVMGVIAVAVPYWGHFRPGGGAYYDSGPRTRDNTGFFGPWNLCLYVANGYAKQCYANANYKVEVYLKIGGVCGLVGVGAMAIFTVLSGLHCAMQINNKKICLKYSTNIFLAFIAAVIAEIATLATVLISIPQFTERKQQYTTELGACYYIEICLIFLNLLLTVLSYLSHKKARRSNFPIQRNPYEINTINYGLKRLADIEAEALTGRSGRRRRRSSSPPPPPPPRTFRHLQPSSPPAPISQPRLHKSDHYRGADSGITVTSSSGAQYIHQPGPTHHQYLGQVAQPQTPAFSGVGYPGALHGYSQPVAAVAPQQRYVPTRDERVDLNPGGRHKLGQGGGAGHVLGSMESLNSSQGSEISFGSTMSSNASINNPLRSSLKKPKNKETVSMNSTASSKKSVRLALGEEQTAV